MTSALTPFSVIARLPGPISAKDVEAVVAQAPKEMQLTSEEILRDLGEIVATKAFGDKTPTLADDLTAQIAKLAPSDKPVVQNRVAVGFAEALTQPPAEGRIYAQAHQLQAAVTGAVVALEGQLATATPEQKADKQALIDGYKTNIASPAALRTFSGIWAAFAQPAGPGSFTVPRDVVEGMAESMAAGAITPKLKSKIDAKNAETEAKNAGGISPQTLKEAIEMAKHEITRPIGGKTDAQLEKIYTKVTTEAQTQRLVHAPERFRTKKYQGLLNVLRANPQAAIIEPILKEAIERFNVTSRRAQKANYTEISKDFDDGDTQLRAVRKVALRVADRIGAGDPSITRVANAVMNAWVSNVDLDNPHITYFSHLQEMVWDDAKGDWLKFHVDPKGEFCEPNAPGAREISGEKLVEVVFAHELTHISEEAVLNQYLLSVMLGVNLNEMPALHAGECLCSTCGAIADKAELAAAIMDDPYLTRELKSAGFQSGSAELAEAFGLTKTIQIANAPVGTAGVDAEAKRSAVAALQDFFLMFTREGESTADFGAVRAMGPEGPKFMAMTFDIVSRTPRAGSLTAFKDSWKRNHEAEAEAKLDYSEEGGKLHHGQYATATTHPTRMLRAMGNFEHARLDSTKALWSFENSPVRFRILGAAHALDSEIESVKDKHAEFKHGTRDHESPEQILKTLEDKHTARDTKKLFARMSIITKEIAKLIFADGLQLDGKALPYAAHVHEYMKRGGEEMFSRSSGGGGNPLAALLGGGGEAEAPQCVKMAAQIADELERIVDNAKIPEKEYAKWAEFIDGYRNIADEDGAKSARTGRTKQSAELKMLAKLVGK